MSTNTDFFSDIDRLRTDQSTFSGVRILCPAEARVNPKPDVQPKKLQGAFLKGPIPLAWLGAVAKLSGKGPLAVGLALWFEAGRRKRWNDLRLTSAILAPFHVNRKTKYAALKALERGGLAAVQRFPRKNPLVSILEDS